MLTRFCLANDGETSYVLLNATLNASAESYQCVILGLTDDSRQRTILENENAKIAISFSNAENVYTMHNIKLQ